MNSEPKDREIERLSVGIRHEQKSYSKLHHLHTGS